MKPLGNCTIYHCRLWWIYLKTSKIFMLFSWFLVVFFGLFSSGLTLSLTSKVTLGSVQCYSLYNILYMLFLLPVFHWAACIVWCLLLYCFYCLYRRCLTCQRIHCPRTVLKCVIVWHLWIQAASTEDAHSEANCVREVTGWEKKNRHLQYVLCEKSPK